LRWSGAFPETTSRRTGSSRRSIVVTSMTLFVDLDDAYPENSPNGPSSVRASGSIVPSRTRSALAGTPIPCSGVRTTSSGAPNRPPAISRSSTPIPTRAAQASMKIG
jgi:hypothetical protein